jgi:serine protease inhibitor
MPSGNYPGTGVTAEMVEGANGLGVRLFLELCRNRPGRNTVVSPQALATALFLLHSGATGDTRTQLARALEIGDGKLEELDRQHLSLARTSDADLAVRLTSAVSLWARRTLRLKTGFLREGRTIGAEIRSLDFDDLNAFDAINDWVRARTNGQIDHLIGPGEIAPGTMLLILTALYFKGQWEQPFDPAQTQTVFFNLADGTAQRQPMMRRTATFSYGEIERCQSVELPFGSGRVCMRVFLPAVPSISENQIMDVLLQRSRLPERLGEVSLPRIHVDVSVDLVKALTAVGVGAIFGPEAEFGRLSDNAVWVGRVKQRVSVKLDEEGTEAASAMSIQFIRTFAPVGFTFIADRPFYWTICDKESNLLILIGYIANPRDR